MANKNNSAMFLGWTKPVFSDVVKTNKNFDRNYQTALMYAHYELSPSDLKKEVFKFLKSIDTKHPLTEKVRNIHENKFSVIGKYIYILNNGGNLPEKVLPTVMPFLEKIINEEYDNKESVLRPEKDNIETEESAKISIQDRLRDKARMVATEIDGWIDNFTADKSQDIKSVEDFVGLFKSNDLKSPHMRHIQLIFKRCADEIEEALAGDKELLEGYSNFSKTELKKFNQFYKNMLKATVMLQEVAKVARAPKKKKAASREKIVSKLKFKKEDSSFGIVSLNPIEVLGAKEVWCFDTKTRKIIRYVADDLLGPLSIKGSSIVGFDSIKSVSKTLRKPADQLAAFKKSGKVQLRTFIDEIATTGILPTGRINENQVILKVL